MPLTLDSINSAEVRDFLAQLEGDNGALFRIYSGERMTPQNKPAYTQEQFQEILKKAIDALMQSKEMAAEMETKINKIVPTATDFISNMVLVEKMNTEEGRNNVAQVAVAYAMVLGYKHRNDTLPIKFDFVGVLENAFHLKIKKCEEMNAGLNDIANSVAKATYEARPTMQRSGRYKSGLSLIVAKVDDEKKPEKPVLNSKTELK
jgi:hypothetical protein